MDDNDNGLFQCILHKTTFIVPQGPVSVNIVKNIIRSV